MLLLPLILLLGLWVPPPLPAWAWGLPGRSERADRAPSSATRAGASPKANRGPQEVAPPAAVQQLSEALSQRQPRIAILEPADGSLLPEGPWTLRLRVEDWPQVNAGSLGLGPHLMVQLDDELPHPLLESTASMPALGPGSHRVTVYAVRPWGEVVKAPGAFRQIRLHRVAANPLSLPAEGSPQLLAVSPSQAIAGEPVLLDWLLIDAPLQNLRADDARWRLRVTINGDSFLVNQQTPLWLKGWKPGSNAVRLELVDGRGEPLNPPFNSLVREVRLDPGSPRPAWLGPRLDGPTLARLLGEAPPAPPTEPETPPENVPSQLAPAQENLVVPPPEPPIPPRAVESQEPLRMVPEPRQNAGSPAQAEVPPEALTPEEPLLPMAEPEAEAPLRSAAAQPSARPEPDRSEEGANRPPAIERPSSLPTPPLPDAPLNPPAASLSMPPVDAGGSELEFPATLSEPNRDALPRQSGESSVAAGTSDRIPSARNEVNADGTLIRPARRSPLQALRERLAR